MSESKKFEIDWFKKAYGINLLSLDPEVIKVVKELGEEGVKKLVEENRETEAYRDERITKGDRDSLLTQIQRLEDEGGGEWAPGQKHIGDKPNDWIENEKDYLEDK